MGVLPYRGLHCTSVRHVHVRVPVASAMPYMGTDQYEGTMYTMAAAIELNYLNACFVLV